MIMEQIIDTILPYTQEDKKCMQKKMIKDRNREVLLKALEKMKADPYLHFKPIFEPTHLSSKVEP